MTPGDREDMIRVRAREIWENEGRPDGAYQRHWDQATLEIEAEENVGTTDNLEDTELTSSLAVQDDPVEDAFLAGGDFEKKPSDLGGRVKDPIDP